MTFFSKTTPMTYAIEQTMEANRGVRFIHLKFEKAGEGGEAGDPQAGGKGARGAHELVLLEGNRSYFREVTDLL